VFLTDKSVKAMKPKAARVETADAGVPGLYLVTQPTGAKSWAIRYRLGGRPAKATLGSFPSISLAAGRDLARTALQTFSRPLRRRRRRRN
jgi:hypothetical protein